MSEELKTIKDEIQGVWENIKKANDVKELEIKKLGEATGETKSFIAKLEERLDQLELSQKNKEIGNAKGEDKTNALEVEKKGFDTFLRKGFIIPEMQKTMISSNDTTGGYFVMPDYVAGEIIKNIVEYSPIRSLARTRQTSSDSVKIRKRTGNITGGQWTSEIGTRQSLGNITYGMEELPLHELTGYVDISNKDLADAQFNLEAELNMEFSEQFGVTEGTAFISGNGVGKPEGFLSNAEVIANLITNGHATEIQADSLIDLFYSLKTAYVNGSGFILNRNTLKLIRKLKDGNGNYLWTPGFTDGRPSMILERPYTECVNMPDVGANTYPVAFGDLKQAYMVVDRTNMEMMRDPYTQAGTGVTRFYGSKRVGGQVIKAEAMKILKISV
jgi:HK97 family phage major capsid protein